MTVIFVTYHSFHSNSSIQVFSLANRMVGFGHRVFVCIPEGKETVTLPGEPRFICCTYEEALSETSQFGGDYSDTIIHAWTPRENVRKCVEKLRSKLSCPIVVHLEDNEEAVTASSLGCDFEELLAKPGDVLDAAIPENLSHPRHYRTFLESASGVTLLIDTLAAFVPQGKPHLMFWPACNEEIFQPTPLLFDERRCLGLADDEVVLAYVGNVTAANRKEVASLYLAVVILRRLGYPARLLRTGIDCISLFDFRSEELSDSVIHLGRMDHHKEIPRILGMANFLVQPGSANAYNDFRFPSKLPEFFSIGRPVLLPDTNLGRFVRDGVDAVILREGHAMEIAERLIELIGNPNKCEQLARAALEFSRKHFDWGNAAKALIRFYQETTVQALS